MSLYYSTRNSNVNENTCTVSLFFRFKPLQFFLKQIYFRVDYDEKVSEKTQNKPVLPKTLYSAPHLRGFS